MPTGGMLRRRAASSRACSLSSSSSVLKLASGCDDGACETNEHEYESYNCICCKPLQASDSIHVPSPRHRHPMKHGAGGRLVSSFASFALPACNRLSNRVDTGFGTRVYFVPHSTHVFGYVSAPVVCAAGVVPLRVVQPVNMNAHFSPPRNNSRDALTAALFPHYRKLAAGRRAVKGSSRECIVS